LHGAPLPHAGADGHLAGLRHSHTWSRMLRRQADKANCEGHGLDGHSGDRDKPCDSHFSSHTVPDHDQQPRSGYSSSSCRLGSMLPCSTRWISTSAAATV
jgi:hypothetical protein